MAPLKDPEVLAKFKEALQEWNCHGFIQWKRIAAEWLRRHLERYDQRAIGCLLHQYVAEGGEIDAVTETREEYRHLYQYHYDFRVPIGDRLVYIETRLDVSKLGPTITVVNVHDA